MSKIYTSVIVRGDKILHRGYNNDQRFQYETLFKPNIFVLSPNKDSEWKTLDGRAVEPFYPGSIKETRDYVESNKDICNFEIFGNTDFQYQFISKEYTGELSGNINNLRICYLDIETECEDGFPNIETADQKINLISLQVPSKKEKGKYVMYSFCVHNKKNVLKGISPNHVVFQFSNEFEMLQQFIDSWQHILPDIITGWNVQFFDIPYIVNRIKRVLGNKLENKLSPWNIVKEKHVFVKNKDQISYELLGISVLDYLELYKKFTFINRESFSLNFICSVELNEEKSKFEGLNSLQDLYKKDFQKFLEYNYRDVLLVVKLEEKLKLMELAISLAYSAKINFVDIFSQVKTWDTIIFNYLNDRKIVIPQKIHRNKDIQFQGAHVKDPQVGIHNWIVSFDLNSLYPHLIMQYNISPETKYVSPVKKIEIPIEHILDSSSAEAQTQFIRLQEQQDFAKRLNLSICPNGIFFYKSKQGFLPALMEKMYQDRKNYKEKMFECIQTLNSNPNFSEQEKKDLEYQISKYDNFQLVRKIQLNSAYGAMGNEYFRYYDTELAEAITISGKLSIRWIEKKINEFLNKSLKTNNIDYVIASDTDSVYLCLDNLVKKYFKDQTDKEKIIKFINKISNEMLQPFINSAFAELASLMNAYDQKMNMKQESISDKGIWTAKKRYILNVMMGEDGILHKEPKLKIMGVETSKSSTPQVVRTALKHTIYLIMNKTEPEMRAFIKEFKNDFNSFLPEDIAFPRSCNNIKTYSDEVTIYKKSTPIAVRGSLLYNNLLKTKKLLKKYPKIKEGEKAKYIYIKKPNPIGENIISFPQTLPKEFELHEYIDYKTQFQKSFVEPLQLILDKIQWSIEKQITLFDKIEETI